MRTYGEFMKKSFLFALTLSVATQAFAQDLFPAPLVTSVEGCAETYHRKAKNLNRIIGYSAGGALLVAGTAASGGIAAIMTLGGLGLGGTIGYDHASERFDTYLDAKFGLIGYKSVLERKPVVIMPGAKQYFDLLNTIEYARLNKEVGEDLDLDILNNYIKSIVLAGYEVDKVKACKKTARKNGLTKIELNEVEDNFIGYSELDLEMSGNPIVKEKIKYVNCLMDIQSSVDDSYPIAEVRSFQSENKLTRVNAWRVGSVARIYSQAVGQAKLADQKLDFNEYLSEVAKADEKGFFCESIKKPLNRANFNQLLLGQDNL